MPCIFFGNGQHFFWQPTPFFGQKASKINGLNKNLTGRFSALSLVAVRFAGPSPFYPGEA